MPRSHRLSKPAFLALLLATLLAAAVLADATIDTAFRYAWAENAGWCDFRGDGAHGARVGGTSLTGYIWLENAGWLSLGQGPSNGTAYSQAAGDTGVNLDSSGNLSGYAWGENIGWVVLNPAGSGQQVTLSSDGHFAGFAWSENIGWIAMNSGQGVTVAYTPARAANWTLYY